MNAVLYFHLLAFALIPAKNFETYLAGSAGNTQHAGKQTGNDTMAGGDMNPPKQIVASKNQHYTLISWISENVQDFDHYEMEVSADRNHFVLSSIIPSIADNNAVKVYNSPVYKIKNNRYARLRMIDKRGIETVSGIIDLPVR